MTVFTPPQVAARWGCKPDTVCRLLKSGALRGFTLSPPGTKRPRWRVSLDAVLAYEAGECTPDRSPSKPRRRATRQEQPSGPF